MLILSSQSRKESIRRESNNPIQRVNVQPSITGEPQSSIKNWIKEESHSLSKYRGAITADVNPHQGSYVKAHFAHAFLVRLYQFIALFCTILHDACVSRLLCLRTGAARLQFLFTFRLRLRICVRHFT